MESMSMETTIVEQRLLNEDSCLEIASFMYCALSKEIECKAKPSRL